MSINLSFHGAAESVTGSCFLLKAGGLNIVIDCGLFQGGDEADRLNYDDFGFDPKKVDHLLLTHGHLDHCGRIPVLVQKGFRGGIVCTSATYDIAKVILMDSAKIQEEDYEKSKKLSRRRGEQAQGPLYTTLDALDSLRYFDTMADYDKPVRLNDDIKVRFRDSGHILGAAFLEIEIKNELRILFSGDLGNRNKPIIKDPESPRDADAIIVEGTYANRNHKNIEDSVRELSKALKDTFDRGGNVLIPSFAVERAQDLLFYFRRMHEKGELPPCNVYLDTPMGINVTNIMRRHPECFDQETAHLFNNHADPFRFPGLRFTKTQEESRGINQIKSRAVIIAGSGMCTGGRIRHHLKHNVWRPECSIVFVGFQAVGTLGRDLVDGNEFVSIFGEKYKVRAKVHTIGGFSSHADKDILIDWLNSGKAGKVFLVHGEKGVLGGFKDELMKRGIGGEVIVPRMGELFSI